VVKRVVFTEPELESPRTVEKIKATNPIGRSMPYVDVPLLKATLRTSKSDRIEEDQGTKFGTAYKSCVPVEIGLDLEKLIETVMDLEINIPLRNLAGVSNTVQKEIKKQVTKTRWPAKTS
jgi:hypothetical protein